MSDLDRSIRRSTAWVAAANGLSGVLDLVTTVAVLWLWVTPAELGIATMASAMFPVLERLAVLGLGQAAVRHADDGRDTLSTILWTSVACSLVVFAVLAIAGPFVGAAFGHRIVGLLLIIYGIKLVTQNLHMIPEALLRHELAFDTLSKIRGVGSIVEHSSKLGVAYLGAHYVPELRIGCFVIAPVLASLCVTIGILLVRPWRPRRVFDRAVARDALRFGSQLSAADLLYFAYTSADYIVVGSVFGAAAVGAYRLAYEMVLDVVKLASTVTSDVVFPAFARLANDRRAAGEQLLRLTRQNMFIVAPMLIVIGVAADDLLSILYPPLGADAGTAVRILCVVGALRTASFVLPPMLAGLGHARDVLAYNLFAAIICPAAFAAGAIIWPSGGYLAVAWAWALAYPLAFALVLWFALKRTDVRLAAYSRSVAPVVGWAVLITAFAYGARYLLPDEAWLRAGGTVLATLCGMLVARALQRL